jgi:two-component system, LytTR family, response regulator AlgR
MRLLIVDDEALARVRMLQLLADIAQQVPHTVVGEAGSVEQCQRLLATLQVDCVLLDIQMPGQSGLALAQVFKDQALKFGRVPAVIFVTAFEQHAVQAFDLAAVDYLVKPVRATRLAEALKRVPLDDDTAPDAAITVSERGRIVKVPLREILYLKAELKYVTIRTRDREFVCEQALTALEVRYAEAFVRVHRNALAARTAITGLQRARSVGDDGDPEAVWEVTLRGSEERLEVSRRQLAQIKTLLRQ